MPLTPGTRLGSYEIVSRLGSGGMGEVYRAKDLKLGRDVAIKVLQEELASAQPVDSRSDVFSFCIVLYEMATGKRPFEGDTAAGTQARILEAEFESVRGLRRVLPRELERVIHRCLKKKPEEFKRGDDQ